MQSTRFVGHGLHCELAAYHEAAHAVVSLHYGRMVKEVFISRHLPGNGWVKSVRLWSPGEFDLRHTRNALLYWARVFSEAEREVKILLAGPLAEAKLLRTPLRSLGARSDLQQALSIHAYLDDLRESLQDIVFIPDHSTAYFLTRMRQQTRRLISQPWCWNAITGLAKDLVGWHRLSGHDVAETVQWSRKPRYQLSLSLGSGGLSDTARDGRETDSQLGVMAEKLRGVCISRLGEISSRQHILDRCHHQNRNTRTKVASSRHLTASK